MDADLAHSPGDLPRLMAGLQDSDAVIGSRYVAGGGTRNWGFIRKLISTGGSLYARTILGLKIRDLTGGFNLWSRRVLEALELDDRIIDLDDPSTVHADMEDEHLEIETLPPKALIDDSSANRRPAEPSGGGDD